MQHLIIGFSCISLQAGEIPFSMSFTLILLLLYQPGRKIQNSGFLLSFVTHSTDEILPGWRISAQASWSCKSHSRHCTDVCQKEYQPLPHSAEPLWVLWKEPLLRNCTAQWSVKKSVKMRKTQYIAIYSNIVTHHPQRLEIKMTLPHLFHLWGLTCPSGRNKLLILIQTVACCSKIAAVPPGLNSFLCKKQTNK